MPPPKSAELYVPPLNDVCQVLKDGLQKHFQEAEVTVSKCPDLREPPFHLAAEGICGEPCLVEVGGVPYLVPLVDKEKLYNLKDVAKDLNRQNVFIIGPGAGPHHLVGVNCELMVNVKLGTDEKNYSYFAKIDANGKCEMEKLNSTEFALLGNFFASNGEQGDVLKVHAKHRTSKTNFVSAMREILAEHYNDKSVGIGGVFLIQKGKAQLHIMPEFSTTPLKNDEDVNTWFKYFQMSAPLVCLSVFVSKDPGLDLRLEHTHCFSQHGEGGHYHFDTTPDEVEYLAYLNVGKRIYRVDQPATSHQFGHN